MANVFDQFDPPTGGNVFDQFDAPTPKSRKAPVASERAPMGSLQAVGRGAAQGVTFGFADELAGAGAASPLPGSRGNAPIPNALDAIAGGARLGLEYLAPSVFGTGGGEAYESKLKEQRELNEQAAQDAPIAYLGGQIAGGMALPLGAVGQATTRGAAALQAAKIGGVTGALYGVGQGEGLDNRLRGAATGGVVGAASGGVLGSIFGKTRQPLTGSTGQEVAAAAERIGVEVPRAIASDSTAVQRMAQGVRNVPFAGDPMVQATDRMMGGLGRAADDVTTALGSGDRYSAGATASTAIKDWIGTASKSVINRAYDDVEKVLSANVTTELNATKQVVEDILSKRGNAYIQGNSRAVSEVLPAINSQGLNYAGIKDLRTRIGELQSGGMLPGDISSGELKRIYGALSADLRTAAERSGGERGLALFERANRLNSMAQSRRESLAKIVGVNGDAPAEAVFDKLLRYAGQKGGGDIALLAQARKVIDKDWDEMASGVISRLGRDAEDSFSPQRFITDWGKLSPAGKGIIFTDRGHRAALEDIFIVSQRAAEGYRKFGNPSGTAQNVGVLSALGGMLLEPVSTISTLIGGNALSRVLANPATAQGMARWSRAYQAAVMKPSRAALSSLTVASRNFSAAIGEKLGLSIDPTQLMRSLAGPRASPASDGQFYQEK